VQNLPSRFIEVFAIFGLFILILINSFTGSSNSVNILIIGAFMAAAYKIIPGIVKILNSAGQVKTYKYTINDLLKEKARTLTHKEKLHNGTSINAVTFCKVSFSYANHQVLNNFSMNIQRGDFAGISGSSGRGKTTVINLVMGFLSATGGNIYINNEIINTNEQERFWKNIAYVKQQSFFIHDTILKNITLDENNLNKEKLQDVIEVTGLNELLGKYKEGIEKLITENGKNISGGQRQRIAIARALYKEADVILLDEPFNELDEASELRLVKYFRKMAESGKIVVLITHNQAALSFCNKIIPLDEA
jgi:ABC-type bacteriocin/lantibiotic exporter with double-glycine peptidase domain